MPTVRELLEFLSEREYEVLGSLQQDSVVERASPINEAGSHSVTFCSSIARDSQSLLAETHAGLIIVDSDIPVDKDHLAQAGVQLLIFSDNARLDFMRLVEHFFAPPRPKGIHATAVIAPSAVIGRGVFVGPLCTIGAEVEIGESTVIYAGVHVYSKARIGRNVTIHSGTVIGADGFGYQRNEAGALEKFTHIGGVVIEDDVEIGANSCVDRGTLGDTRICRGARIDNLVHVAHNVHVGKHAAVIANAMIGGGTHIGDYGWVAPSACLRDGISIGVRSMIGMAALVTKDVPNSTTVLGAPARDLESQKRLLAHWATVIAQDDEGGL